MDSVVPVEADPDLQNGPSPLLTPSTRRARLTVHRITFGGYAVMATLLGVLVSVVSRYPFHPGIQTLNKTAWVDGWYQFDAGWYNWIALDGYFYNSDQQSSIAFFPTYPLTLRGLGQLSGNIPLTGVLLSMTCGLLSVALFSTWIRSRLTRNAAITAVLLLLLYPYSFFLYGAMYADSMFLLTAIGAFMLLERRHFWLAGLVGALATAGRSVGVAVAIGLVVRMLEILAEDRATGGWEVRTQGPVRARELMISVRSIRWKQFGVFASGVGIAGWMTYLWLTFGNPLAFLSTQGSLGWDQGSGPRTWFKIAFLGHLVKGPLDIAVTLTAQAICCLIAILLLHRVWRRFGWGYCAYALTVIAIPIIGTKDFMGTGRYMMVAFPIFAVAAELLAQPRWRWARVTVMVVMTIGLFIATTYYARGFEVS